MDWSELSAEEQERLKGPRSKLSRAERKLRKELFFGSGWIDSAGHLQQWKPRKESKRREG